MFYLSMASAKRRILWLETPLEARAISDTQRTHNAADTAALSAVKVSPVSNLNPKRN